MVAAGTPSGGSRWTEFGIAVGGEAVSGASGGERSALIDRISVRVELERLEVER
jgi:hypothetical protein